MSIMKYIFWQVILIVLSEITYGLEFEAQVGEETDVRVFIKVLNTQTLEKEQEKTTLLTAFNQGLRHKQWFTLKTD